MLRHELDIGCQVWAWCRTTRTVRFASVLGDGDGDDLILRDTSSFAAKPYDCFPTRRAALEDSLAHCHAQATYYREHYVEDYQRAAVEIAAQLAGLPPDEDVEDYDPEAVMPNCTEDIRLEPREDIIQTRLQLASEDV